MMDNKFKILCSACFVIVFSSFGQSSLHILEDGYLFVFKEPSSAAESSAKIYLPRDLNVTVKEDIVSFIFSDVQVVEVPLGGCGSCDKKLSPFTIKAETTGVRIGMKEKIFFDGEYREMADFLALWKKQKHTSNQRLHSIAGSARSE